MLYCRVYTVLCCCVYTMISEHHMVSFYLMELSWSVCRTDLLPHKLYHLDDLLPASFFTDKQQTDSSLIKWNHRESARSGFTLEQTDWFCRAWRNPTESDHSGICTQFNFKLKCKIFSGSKFFTCADIDSLSCFIVNWTFGKFRWHPSLLYSF